VYPSPAGEGYTSDRAELPCCAVCVLLSGVTLDESAQEPAGDQGARAVHPLWCPGLAPRGRGGERRVAEMADCRV